MILVECYDMILHFLYFLLDDENMKYTNWTIKRSAAYEKRVMVLLRTQVNLWFIWKPESLTIVQLFAKYLPIDTIYKPASHLIW